ncbi:hypothetical protein D3C76_1751710 [compost metagenome]
MLIALPVHSRLIVSFSWEIEFSALIIRSAWHIAIRHLLNKISHIDFMMSNMNPILSVSRYKAELQGVNAKQVV